MTINQKELRLGLIGMSEGNGHPFSWSAICNGYDPTAIQDCEFPAIATYLGQQKWPAARMSGVTVSHVWTQDRKVSRRIADAGLINRVVNEPSDMLGEVDALLLARDDAENHMQFARPFLEADLPVYVDKPVALTEVGFDTLLSFCSRPSQIYSCSALRFSQELCLTDSDILHIGEVRQVIGITPKSWQKYAIHLIDPVFIGLQITDGVSVRGVLELGGDGRILIAQVDQGPELIFIASGSEAATNPIEIRYIGSRGSVRKVFSDTFSAFKAALQAFVVQVRTGHEHTPIQTLRPMVRVLEAGLYP